MAKKAIKATTKAKVQPDTIALDFVEMGMINPKKIDLNVSFQREHQTSRAKVISRSMDMMGGMFDYSDPVVLDQHSKCVDGMHRVKLARERNMKEIPFVRYNFATNDDVIRYFQLKQIKTQGMKARDELYAYLQSGHPYAVLIYKICEDSKCLLSGFHDLKVGRDHKSSNEAIKVENICYIVNAIVLNLKTGWSRNRQQDLGTKALEIISSQQNLALAIKEVDEFIKFYFNSFGWETDKKDLKFRDHFLQGFLITYKDVLVLDKRFEREKNKLQNKLRRFKLTVEITKNHKEVISQKLLNHINKRRKVENCYV